jgi:hypothetical protein
MRKKASVTTSTFAPSRRSALVGSSCVFVPSVSLARSRPAEPAQLQADLERYASFGSHQSGSTGDQATVQWISSRISASGYRVSLQPIDVPFFDETRATVTLSNGSEFIGIGQHPITLTSKGGLLAPLTLWREDQDPRVIAGKIAVVMLPFGRHSSSLQPVIAGAIKAASEANPKALIVVTDGPSGEALALNALDKPADRPMPILVLGSRGIQPVLQAARNGASATLYLEGQTGRRIANNVVGRRVGTGKKIVLTTPLSGWFTCAAERGSGVSAFLALADWLAKAHPNLDVTLGAMTGHEFENLGSKKFNAQMVPPPGDVNLWVHLGASFAARDWHELAPGLLAPLPSMDAQHFLLGHESFLPILRQAMKGVPGFEVPYVASVEAAAGEAKQILIDGYTKLIANFGAHRLHHARSDGLQAIDGALVSQAYVGLQSAVSRILA